MPDLSPQILSKFIAYSKQQADVKSLISFGSLDPKKRDQYSDLDFFILTDTPFKYYDAEDDIWLESMQVGPVLSRIVVIETPGLIYLNRIMLEAGLTLDIIALDIRCILDGIQPDTPASRKQQVRPHLNMLELFLRRGYQVLYDEIDIEQTIRKVFSLYEEKRSQDKALNFETFNQCYHRFWQTCYEMNRRFQQDDFYYAVLTLDKILKQTLIQAIEWQMLLQNPNQDVFFSGAKMKKWCSPKIIETLEEIFPNSDQSTMRKSIQRSIAVFQQHAHPLAAKVGFSLVEAMEKQVTDSLERKAMIEYDPFSTLQTLVDQLPGQDSVQALISVGEQNNVLFCFSDRHALLKKIDYWKKLLPAWHSAYFNANTWHFLLINGWQFKIVLCPRFSNLKAGLVQNLSPQYFNQWRRNFSVLYDNIGISDELQNAHIIHQQLPASKVLNAANFHSNYHQFWQSNYKMMIKLSRRDFYYAVTVVDKTSKRHLAQLLEWYSELVNPEARPYAQGELLSQWCPEDLVGILRNSFPHQSIGKMRQAILKAMDVYLLASHALAETHGYTLNKQLENIVYQFALKGQVYKVAEDYSPKNVR